MVTLALQTRTPKTPFGTTGWPTAEALLAAAMQRSGLSESGGSGFLEGLRQFLASAAAEGQLGPEAQASVIDVLTFRLENRLRVEDWHRNHPQAADLPILAPLCITGLPRTGTSALATLMSLDEQFRPLRRWEQAEPWLHGTADTLEADPRRVAFLERLSAFVAANPGQNAMHIYEIDAADEDHDVLGLAMMAQHNTLPVPAYRAWWRKADMTAAYAYHRRVLQVLDADRGDRPWLLKAPHYSFHMPDIAHVYPDVRFIFTHRDPVKALPSYMSFVVSFYPEGTVDRIGLHRIAADIYEHLLEGMRAAVEARATMDGNRFVDVGQNDLSRDTIGTLERLYGALELPFTGRYGDAVRAWNAEYAAGSHGAHRYTPEQFGLTAEKIRADFAFYTDRYSAFCR